GCPAGRTRGRARQAPAARAARARRAWSPSPAPAPPPRPPRLPPPPAQSSPPPARRAPAMKTIELASTGMLITPVGFGAWALGGGGFEWSWGAQDDEESIAAIHHALDLGVNWIDTAAQYGFGHSEAVVGRAIAGLTERPYIFTKG